MQYTVTKTSSTTGYFEHNQLGEDCSGSLRFDLANNLVDYDGVFSLPLEVIETLRAMGITVSALFE